MAIRAAATALCVLAILSGCSADSEEPDADATLAVYVSLPLRGAQGHDGRDARDGAKLALADAGGKSAGVSIEPRYLDDTDGRTWTPDAAAANARAATEDSTGIAYLGDFASGATRASLPVTNEAHLLQVSPASGAVDLVAPDPGSDEVPGSQPSGERSFGRVIPADDAQARAAADWVERLGLRRVATLSDGSEFGDVLVDEFSLALERVDVTRRDDPQLLYFGGTADREPASAVRGFPAGLMASDAVLEPDAVRGQPDGTRATSAALDPGQLPPAGGEFAAAFEERFDRRPGRYAAYGYEAMAVILDAIERASDPTDRAAVVDAFFETADRDSVLGPYSIDEVGDTTLERLGAYRVEHGRARPVGELSAGP